MTLDTPTGQLVFSAWSHVVSGAGVGSGLALRCQAITPKLPPGLSVHSCVAMWLEVPAPAAAHGFSLQVELVSPLPAKRESGEGFEALVWRAKRHLVVIGSEAPEVIASRLWRPVSLDRSVPGDMPGHLRFHVGAADDGQAASLHVVVAWNGLPERVDGACWFAADQAHADVLQAVRPARW